MYTYLITWPWISDLEPIDSFREEIESEEVGCGSHILLLWQNMTYSSYVFLKKEESVKGLEGGQKRSKNEEERQLLTVNE